MPEFRLGKYQLLVELARGGMGIVYVAAASGPGGFSKVLIIKELMPELAEDPTFLSMFLEEARLAARLEHPNIVQTIEVGDEGNRHYIAMEYLQGQTLARVRRRKRAELGLNGELRILTEVLQGLHYAHTLHDYDGSNLGIVHRDVSPQNVFVTYDGLVKVMDFGIAKAADTQLETKAGTIKGKAAYMAPEVLQGNVDPRADVFAVGAMIWEAVSGRRLWSTKSEVEILSLLMQGEIPKLAEAKPDAPAELIRICDKAMAKDPENRYESAEALRSDIEAYLATAGATPSLREIGAMVATAFQAEREEVRRLIEAQRQEIRRGAASRAQLPHVDSRAIDGQTPSDSRRRAPAAASGPISSVSASGVTTAGDVVESPAKRRWILGAAVGAVAVAAIAFAAFRMSTTHDAAVAPPGPTTSVAQAPPPMPTAPPAAPNEATPSYAVVMRVAPASASITLNGVHSENPLATRCTRGDTLHFVVTARGFDTMTKDVSCAADLTFDLALERETFAGPAPVARPARPNVVAHPTATAATPPPPASTAPAPTSTDVGITGGKRPKRAIDSTSPYGAQ